MFTNIISTKRSNIKFKTKVEDVVSKDIQPQLQPWEYFDYSPEKEQAMYVGWGRHCAWQQEMELAQIFFNRALDIRSDDAKALFSRSSCERSLADSKQAFEDSLRATYLEPFNPKINKEFCYTLYELNEFEATLAESKNISQLYDGPYRKMFEDFYYVTHENLKDSLGDAVHLFFNKNRRICDQVLQDFKLKNSHDRRPLWKILQEQKECDVMSLSEKKEGLVHPLEKARRERCSRVFYQRYLQRSWIDFITLRDISKNDKSLGKAFKESTPKLQQLLKTQTEAVKKFAKMLHERCPLYSKLEYHNKCKKLWEGYRDSHLYRVQYQTRRNMLIILRNIRHLTEIGAIEKLSRYVEKAMGDYIILKTHRVAPWKFEFMHTVYKSLAVAYANEYTVPPNFEISDKSAWETLLRLPKPIELVVNDQDFFTLRPKEKPEKDLRLYRKFLRRMDGRLYFAKNPMERAYIYHEIACANFKANHMVECVANARKGIHEAMEHKHYLYALLCALMAVRAQACNFKIARTLYQIEKANELAKILGSSKLVEFTEVAKILIEMKIAEQRSSSKVERRTRGKTRASTVSLFSGDSFNADHQSMTSNSDKLG